MSMFTGLHQSIRQRKGLTVLDEAVLDMVSEAGDDPLEDFVGEEDADSPEIGSMVDELPEHDLDVEELSKEDYEAIKDVADPSLEELVESVTESTIY